MTDCPNLKCCLCNEKTDVLLLKDLVISRLGRVDLARFYIVFSDWAKTRTRNGNPSLGVLNQWGIYGWGGGESRTRTIDWYTKTVGIFIYFVEKSIFQQFEPVSMWSQFRPSSPENHPPIQPLGASSPLAENPCRSLLQTACRWEDKKIQVPLLANHILSGDKTSLFYKSYSDMLTGASVYM